MSKFKEETLLPTHKWPTLLLKISTLLEILFLKLKFTLVVEEKVRNYINILGHLTSGLKGGVQILQTPEEVRDLTKQMIGYNLITHQTTKDGLKVEAVLIHEGVDIKRQIYFAFILDRNSQSPAIVCSTEGGV